MSSPSADRSAPLRLLLVRLSALGDVLFSLPALRALREGFPEATIHFAVQEELAPALEGHPDLDEVVPVPIRGWRSMLGRPRLWRQLWRELRHFFAGLRARRYDGVLDVHGNLKSGLLTWMTGAPLRVGPAPGESREGNHLFMTDRAPAPESRRRHRRERALALLPVLGLEPGDHEPRVPDYPRGWAEELLGKPDGRARVLLHPGTSPRAAFKRWPAERFGELACALADAKLRVLVTGGPGEEELVGRVIRQARGAAVALPSPPGLPELGGLLTSVDLVVAADSGPACMADACGTPTVVVFGPKDPALYGPRHGVAIRRELPCAPCGRRSCSLERVECLEDLDPAPVVELVRTMLEGRVPGGTSRAGRVRVRVETDERAP